MKTFFFFSDNIRKGVAFLMFILLGLFYSDSLRAVNTHFIKKTPETLISIPFYNPGDTFVIYGDTLETTPFNDWGELRSLSDDYHLVLQTLNLTVPDGAFTDCSTLQTISLPNATTLGNLTFLGCIGLETINLPKVVFAGNSCFSGCLALEYVNFPYLTAVEDGTFYNCQALQAVILPGAVTVGSQAFVSCFALETVDLPQVTTVGYMAFYACFALQMVHIPNAITLGDMVFYSCSSLKTIEIPQIQQIGELAFMGTSILSVELGDTPPAIKGIVGGFLPFLVIVPDSNVYIPLDPNYPPGSEVFQKTVPTEPILWSSETPFMLIPDRIPTLPDGTFQWKKDGFPVTGADSSSYQVTDEGEYTLEYTYGGTIVLLSKFVTKDLFNFYGHLSRYEDCMSMLVLSFTPSATDREVVVRTEGSGAAYVSDFETNHSFKHNITYELPALDSILVIRYVINSEVENGSQARFVYRISGGFSKSTETFNLYKRPTIKLQKYIPPTVHYKGQLDVLISNGSPFIQRSLNKGVSWEFARDRVTGELKPFSQSQIVNLPGDSIILFREPNTCAAFDTLRVVLNTIDPVINRPVILPEIPGAICSRLPGLYYVLSGNDFSFTITPIPGNEEMNLDISTSRTLIPDSEGLSVVKHNDGSYTVTIYRIQESTTIYVNFVTANGSVEATKVFGSNGQLSIYSEKEEDAFIYSISGTIGQAVHFNANETLNIPLAKGYYLVVINGKTYKVVIH